MAERNEMMQQNQKQNIEQKYYYTVMEEQEGMLLLRLIKRGYHIDMEQIKEGLAPLKLTRIVKSVKYMLYWEFDTKENYGAAQKNLYNSYWKPIEKCLIVPHDKYLGEPLFSGTPAQPPAG